MISLCPFCLASAETYLDYRLIGKGDYRLKQCSSCQLIFTEPLPSPEFLKDFYQSYDSFGLQDNYYSEIKNYPTTPAGRELKKVFNDLISKLHLEKNFPILDLGSGGGAFLDILKRSGYQGVGVEISLPAADFARRQFGVTVVNEPVETVQFISGSCGAVFMWDLLEHLREPAIIIKKINSWLRPKGYLILETPNSRALINKIIIFLVRIGIKWPAAWMFGYHHLFWYSSESLVKLLTDGGFKVFSINKSNTLAERIFPWSWKFFLPRLALESINFVTNIIGGKNKLLVVAQKI